jgi:hypothetical protein
VPAVEADEGACGCVVAEGAAFEGGLLRWRHLLQAMKATELLAVAAFESSKQGHVIFRGWRAQTACGKEEELSVLVVVCSCAYSSLTCMQADVDI